MKPAIIPIFCSVVLVSLAAAGASHWWSVRQLVAGSASPARENAAPAPPAPQPVAAPAVKPVGEVTMAPQAAPARVEPPPTTSEIALQKMLELNQKTLEEVKRLSKENKDLKDQMAETNRDLINLQFRVDTHSESFRPLPTAETRQDATMDVNRLDSNGVLPVLEEPLPLPVR